MRKELNTASNIKNRKNRSNVEICLKSIIEKLKNINNNNGLFIFSGILINGEHIIEILVPEIPSSLSYYRCDNKFHVWMVQDLFKKDEKSLLLVLIYGDYFSITEHSKNYTKTIYSHDNRLIKRQRKGGQSSVRFSRLAEESRQFYIETVKTKIHSILLESKLPIVIDGSRELSTFLFTELKEPVKILHTEHFISEGENKSESKENKKVILSLIDKIYDDKEERLQSIQEEFLRFSELFVIGMNEIEENKENIQYIVTIDNINSIDEIDTNKEIVLVPISSRTYAFFLSIGGIIGKKYY